MYPQEITASRPDNLPHINAVCDIPRQNSHIPVIEIIKDKNKNGERKNNNLKEDLNEIFLNFRYCIDLK